MTCCSKLEQNKGRLENSQTVIESYSADKEYFRALFEYFLINRIIFNKKYYSLQITHLKLPEILLKVICCEKIDTKMERSIRSASAAMRTRELSGRSTLDAPTTA